MRRFQVVITALALLSFGAPGGLYGAMPPYLETSPRHAEVYEGEELSVVYTLHFAQRAPAIIDIAPPSHSRVLITENPPERLIRGEAKQVGEKSLYRARIASYAVIPLEPGSHEIAGYSILAIQDRDGAASPDSILLEAPSMIIDARPLPSGAPDTYSGSVGHFTLDASLDSDTVSAGEPVTITITATGKGISVLEGDLVFHLPKGGTTITSSYSSREAIHTFRPTEPGIFEFIPATLTCFDPTLHRYTTIAAPPLRLTVEKRHSAPRFKAKAQP